MTSSFFACSSAMSVVMNVPVRPTPALERKKERDGGEGGGRDSGMRGRGGGGDRAEVVVVGEGVKENCTT